MCRDSSVVWADIAITLWAEDKGQLKNWHLPTANMLLRHRARDGVLDRLLAQAEFLDKRPIVCWSSPREVTQQTSSLADEHEKTATRGVILLRYLEMLGQLLNTGGHDGDLDLGGTRVIVTTTVLVHDFTCLI